MAMTQNPIIDIQGLTKVFRGNDDPAVNGIDLQIFQNEIFGLLGPNGAGKTTTISMLCGLFPPTSGSVKIYGKDMRNELGTIKKMVGIVPQDIALYLTPNAWENLDFCGHVWIKGIY
ncbi:MAG: ATP-binding cassette domain-containing protein [Ferruginibacter sp.]|nr:ATP-binding cassette domain-containing protein [Ferruginibacter sp.]